MNFLGIGPGEFFFILIVALLVIGPERLPGFARAIGRGLVRLRNWINTSPDAQLFIQVQNELQTEIEDIRSTLRQEMQSVRAEVESVRGDLNTASRTIDGSLQEAASASTITPPTTATTVPMAATPNNTPMTATPSTTPASPTPADVANTIAARQAESAPASDTTTASDVTTPMTLGSVTAATPDTPADAANDSTATSAPTQTVARSRKPNWATTTPKDDHVPGIAASDSDTAPDAMVADPAREQLMAEVHALRQELSQMKQLSGTAASGVSHDAFMMMRIEIEQLTRDLKNTRDELARVQQPTTASSVSHDAFMMMKLEMGQLTQRLEELQKQLPSHQQNSES